MSITTVNFVRINVYALLCYLIISVAVRCKVLHLCTVPTAQLLQLVYCAWIRADIEERFTGLGSKWSIAVDTLRRLELRNGTTARLEEQEMMEKKMKTVNLLDVCKGNSKIGDC